MVLPQAGVNLVAETDQYEKGIRKAIRESDKADRAFTDLVQAANRLDRALDIDGKVKVDVDDSELSRIEKRLEDIQELVTIEVAISAASLFGAGQNILGGILGAATGPLQDLIDIDRVLGQVEARTGGMLPNARELISELWVNGWGESREELGQVITKLSQLGIEQDKIGASATAVLATSQIMGTDIGEILRTTSSLITNDLAPNIEAATDLIIRGLQETGDPADDLLDTLNEYSSTFKGLGIDGQLAISILDSALEDAFFDTDKAADALREFRIRVSEIDNNDTNQTLDKLGLLDDRLEFMADPGQFGPRFLSDVIENIGAIEDPAQRAFATTALFGTQLEDLGPTALAALDPLNLFNGLIKDIPGATATASSAINNNLGQAILELKRTVSEELLVVLDETFDISGKIDTAKEKVQEFAALLRSGTGFGAALEITFGLETGTFDALVGQLKDAIVSLTVAFIAISIALTQLFSRLPGVGAGADPALAELGRLRLAFELATLQTPAERAGAFGRAADVGVAEETLLRRAGETVTGLIGGETVTAEEINAANEFVDALAELGPSIFTETPLLTNLRNDIDEVEAAVTNAALTAAQFQADPDSFLVPTKGVKDATTAFDDMGIILLDTDENLEKATTAMERFATNTGIVGNKAISTFGDIDTSIVAMSDNSEKPLLTITTRVRRLRKEAELADQVFNDLSNNPAFMGALNVVGGGGGGATTDNSSNTTNSNNTTNVTVFPPGGQTPLAEGVGGAPQGPSVP